MSTQEWSRVWTNERLDVALLQAHYVRHAYPRHSHDYYVITLIERGHQSFSHQGSKHFTPAGGVILINPGAVHTGEAADRAGFQMRCIYPTMAHMEAAVYELTGRHGPAAFFREVRVDQCWARDSILALHRSLVEEVSPLECDSRFIWTLAQLVRRHADLQHPEQRLGNERQAIQRAQRYIDERYAESISLGELAAHASLSRYYFLRAFRAAVGMPPHAYQASVRVRQAQRMIREGRALAEVAAESGFSSQSHLTHQFKKIIGVTPGQYGGRVSGLG
jgi:AraC-like DNA-binding protein